MNMKNGVLCAAAAMALLASGLPVRAYDTYVIHPALSRAVGEAFNRAHPTQALTSQQIGWLAAGSIREDEPALRVLNHFYDPQSHEGLRVGGVRLGWPSPQWALSSARQREKFGEGDCSWERALAEYRRDNQAAAYVCLGQVLHLLEDASVPAHVRNDQHLDGDPYEQWLKFHHPPVAEPEKAVRPRCRQPDSCIADLATWINEHFVSQDTIDQTDFRLPLDGARVAGMYLMSGERRLAAYNPKRKRFWLPGAIQAAYWQEISPVMVAYGQRLVELFRSEIAVAPARDEKQKALSKPGSIGEMNIDDSSPQLPALPPWPESDEDQSSIHKATEPEMVHAELSHNPVPALSGTSGQSAEPANIPEVPAIEPETFMTKRPASRTRQRSADFSFASDQAIAAFQCRINEGEWQACLTELHLDNLGDGPHQLAARAVTDSAIDASPVAYGWTVDALAPATFLLANADAGERQATFRFFSEPEAAFFCRLDENDWSECQSPMDYEGLLAGPHIFRVKAVDDVGNEEIVPSAYAWTISIDPPAAPELLTQLEQPVYTNQNDYSLRVRACSGCSLAVSGSEALSGRVSETEWSVRLSLAPSRNTAALRAVNQYGESSPAIEAVIILDTAPPSASIRNLPDSYPDSGFAVSWEGRDEHGLAGYDVDYRIDRGDWQSWVRQGAEASRTFSEELRIGQTAAFRVRATDLAGNRGEWSPVVSTVRDSLPARHLVISQIGRRENNGLDEAFIELYNPMDRAWNLGGFHLEASDSIGLAWSSALAGDFPAAAAIAPHGYYLIAQGWTEAWPDTPLKAGVLAASGHIRLRDAAGGEIDRLGYGSAQAAERAAAPALVPGSGLERKAALSSAADTIRLSQGNGLDSDDNSFDFFAQPRPHPRGSQERIEASDLRAGLNKLWHFDECAGEVSESIGGQAMGAPPASAWSVGRYGCAIRQTYQGDTHFRWRLAEPVPPGELTVSLYVQAEGNSSGIVWLLDESANFRAGFWPNPSNARVVHNGNYSPLARGIPAGRWVLATMVYSRDYLAWYLDGELVQKIPGDYRVTNPMAELMMAQESGPWSLDEVAIWSRALSRQDIAAAAAAQLVPRLERPLPPTASLEHYWNFDEAGGPAEDRAGVSPMAANFRTAGWRGSALYINFHGEYHIDLDIPPLASPDMSLSFWRRDGPLQGGGSGNLVLRNTARPDISFGAAGGFERSYIFHNAGYEELGPLIPRDDRWHHIAAVYDSYAYQLRYYIDGQEKAARPAIWLHLPFNRLTINEAQGTFSVDDLKIWRGALTAESIKEMARELPD